MLAVVAILRRLLDLGGTRAPWKAAAMKLLVGANFLAPLTEKELVAAKR